MEGSEAFSNSERKKGANRCFIRFHFLKNSEKMLWNWQGLFGSISISSCIMVPNKYSIGNKRTKFN